MTRLLRRTASAVSTCACIAAAIVQAEAKAPGAEIGVSRELVEQKLSLLKRVLSDSPAAKRIEASQNAAARGYLSDAHENYRKALLSIKSDDLAAADRQLNNATSLMGKARQLVPDPAAHDTERRAQYARMLDSVESLRSSYHGHLPRARSQPRGAEDPLLAKVARLVDSARAFAQAGQIEQANKLLAEAERTLMAGLGQMLGSTSVEYAQHFETAAEEYAYELERNRSYAELIPIAMDAFKPSAEAVREARRFVDGDRGLREQAQRHAAAKDYRAALTALRGGTSQLQSALASVGLRVPQHPKAR